jgi:soluble P-type ATPase
MKPGILIEIPGFGKIEFRSIVSDYTGTHSRGGKITHEVERRLIHLSELVDIHILTADTFGTAERELGDIPVSIHRLLAEAQDVQKMEFVRGCQPQYAAAFGNGNNDRLLLKTVREAGGLAVAVDNGEGCAIEALQNANLFIVGAENALDLLIETKRLKATLRF